MSDRVTVSIIKADVGSVCGHSRPHPKMMESCREVLRDGLRAGTVNDFYVTRVGDDINLFMTHNRGENSKDVHGLAWEAFKAATKLAKDMKMYAAGQDILKDAFSGNVRGMGPGSAEMEFKERGAEPLIFFMADKTEPSAYSMPLSRVFMDPYTTTGLVIDPRAHVGFKFEIVDVIDSKKIVMS
ncbi:MAG: fructose 1,6-bisphosphatase, partial [Methanomassiliicoccales archaeon]